MSLFINNMVGCVPKKGSVIRVEEHFLWAAIIATSSFLTACRAEEEDVAMTVRGCNVVVVWTPFGVVDRCIALNSSCAPVHGVVMLEHCCVCCNVPDDEEAVVGARHEQVGQGGVRLEDVHLVLVTHQPLQQGLNNCFFQKMALQLDRV